MKSFIYFLIISTQILFAQSKDADEIVDNVVAHFNKVKDYQVDVKIKVDVEFLKVPETKAKIYFKQPDKFHLEADGFAMLPKNGFQFSPAAITQKAHTAIYEQDVVLNGIKTSIVKIIPSGEDVEVILSTLWIDQQKQVIRKVESTTKTNGTFTIDFSYDDKMNYPVPNKLIFAFNVDKMNIPATISGETSSEKPEKGKKTSSITKGKVIVNYYNYIINKGILDSVFDKKKNNMPN